MNIDHGGFDDRNRLYRAKAENHEVFEVDRTSWVVPKPLSESRVSIVTTAGLRNDGVTDWQVGDQGFVVLDGKDTDHFVAHASQNFDRSGFAADINVVYPVDRLAELATAGEIGSVGARHISFMGAQTDHTLTTLRLDSGPAAAKVLRDDGVDVVLLTPV